MREAFGIFFFWFSFFFFFTFLRLILALWQGAGLHSCWALEGGKCGSTKYQFVVNDPFLKDPAEVFAQCQINTQSPNPSGSRHFQKCRLEVTYGGWTAHIPNDVRVEREEASQSSTTLPPLTSTR